MIVFPPIAIILAMNKLKINKKFVTAIILALYVIQIGVSILLLLGLGYLWWKVNNLEEKVDLNINTISTIGSQEDEQEEADESTNFSDTIELDFRGDRIIIRITREVSAESDSSFFDLEMKSVSYPDEETFMDAVYEDGTFGTYLFYLQETGSFYELFPSGASRLSLISESDFEDMLGTSTTQDDESTTITECSKGSTKINEIEFDTLECEFTDTWTGEDLPIVTNSVECLYEVKEGLYFIDENILASYGADIDTCAGLGYENVVGIDAVEY